MNLDADDSPLQWYIGVLPGTTHVKALGTTPHPDRNYLVANGAGVVDRYTLSDVGFTDIFNGLSFICRIKETTLGGASTLAVQFKLYGIGDRFIANAWINPAVVTAPTNFEVSMNGMIFPADSPALVLEMISDGSNWTFGQAQMQVSSINSLSLTIIRPPPDEGGVLRYINAFNFQLPGLVRGRR